MFETVLRDRRIDDPQLPHHQPNFAFIDADNVWRSYENALDRIGLDQTEKSKFDFFRLFQIIPHDRCYAYSATNDSSESPEWLRGLEREAGFLLKLGELVEKKRVKKQEGVDVKLAIDATRLAYSNIMKTCTLYGADGDFLPLVEAVSEAGTLINIASFNDPEKGRVAPRLRALADRYFLLNYMWVYETLFPAHRTVQNILDLRHQWERFDQRLELEFHGMTFEVREIRSTWIVNLPTGGSGIWRGSHNFDDLRIWLKLSARAIQDSQTA